MDQSKLYIKTLKEAPKDEVSLNARLLEQGGFVQKVLAGVYNFLPLGVRVLHKIEDIVRDEMNTVGAEVFMSSLEPKENWVATGRWDSFDVLFKLDSQHGYQYVLGPTHEETFAPLAKRFISSYRDLPAGLYQIQTKFRDEARAKSGLMRGREFRMKDLYSFHPSQESLDKYYDEVIKVYFRVFERVGLNAIFTEASGGSFSKFSHEFQVEVPSGEDILYICEKCGLAKNKEIFEDGSECSNCGKTTWRETKAAEVGNIFKLGTKYSIPFGLNYTDQDGEEKPVIMASYGIGTSRLVGVVAEICNDAKGLIWPKNIAPFAIHLIPLSSKNGQVQKTIEREARELQSKLEADGYDVLYDDRDESAGVKFADADLIGIPLRIVVSEKTLDKQSIEIKARDSEGSELVPVVNAVTKIKELYGNRR